MNFDLQTKDTACKFLLNFMQMSKSEYLDEYVLKCDSNYEIFWDRNFQKIDSIDISNIRVIAFHVVGSLDDCAEIKETGLKNLQQVLTDNSKLNTLLKSCNMWFDIGKHKLYYNDKSYDIHYDSHNETKLYTEKEQKLHIIARRIYFDFCINGFLTNDDIYSYGTDIHTRPEFIKDLVDAFPNLQKLETEWIQQSKPYKVIFYSYLNQIDNSTFDINNLDDPPYVDWINLSCAQKIKKWMLGKAIARVNDSLPESYLYIKDNLSIPPNQIIDCVRI